MLLFRQKSTFSSIGGGKMRLEFRFFQYTVEIEIRKKRLINGGSFMERGEYGANEIANWFLNKEEMSHKKLQKLCYYAQAWGYTLLDEKLIDDDFKAWVHGPVSPSLYQCYKGSGWSKLKLDNEAQLPKLTTEQEELLESVWLTYGDMTANALEVLTHDETPWKEARRGLSSFERGNRDITLAAMKDFYSTLYEGEVDEGY